MKNSRTALFLMANLGSDISQVFLHIERGELKLAESAVSRAERIMEELILHPELFGRDGEIKILQDIVRDLFLENRRLDVKRVEIEEYFMPFALRLMAGNR